MLGQSLHLPPFHRNGHPETNMKGGAAIEGPQGVDGESSARNTLVRDQPITETMPPQHINLDFGEPMSLQRESYATARVDKVNENGSIAKASLKPCKGLVDSSTADETYFELFRT